MRLPFYHPLRAVLAVVFFVGVFLCGRPWSGEWSAEWSGKHALSSAVAITSALADEAHAAPPSSAAVGAVGAASGSPGASASSSAGPGASASARPASTAEIRVRERVILVLRSGRAERTVQDRARVANDAITALLAHPEEIGEVRYEEAQGVAVIYVGKTPVVTLGPEDVQATGDANVNVLAAQVTTRLSDAMATERKRSAIATTVFSFALLIFSALIAFLLLQRASDVAARIRSWLVDDPGKVTGLSLGKIEFVSAGAARGALSIALTLGYRVIQIAIAYGWLILALSLFDATRGYTQKLTGIMVTPLYALASRIGSALPLVVVAGIAVVAVTVLVRFVGLFFDSVARGETRMVWLPRDLAPPTSIIARSGIVVLALVLASPMITGSEDGALSRVGLVALVALALAATPLLASAAVGVVIVFGRRVRKGELVEFGGRSGRVMDVTLLEVRLEDAAATEISVPHLLGLVHPTRVHRHPPLGSIELVVDGAAPVETVEKALTDAARELSTRARVELLYIDDGGAHWRVTSALSRGDHSLARSIREALARIGVGFGRARAPRPAASASASGSGGAARSEGVDAT